MANVTRDMIAKAVARVGVKPGDVVMFHSSLSSMGHVQGGADTVIDAFIDAAGPDGTVAVPTLCRLPENHWGNIFELWHIDTSPSYVGRITETLRRSPQAVRSDHATHSIAAVGRRADELAADHGSAGPRQSPWGDKAFARASPWQRFYDWNAAYCFLGVNFEANTMVHLLESIIAERDLAAAADRDAAAKQVRGFMKAGVWPMLRITDRIEHEDRMHAEGLEHRTAIGNTVIRCLRARDMLDRWLAIIDEDPDRWLPDDYLAWRRSIAPS